jgi:hypothetical protein
VTDRGGHRPPRGYSWEPFTPGNAAAVKHGAHSPARVDPLAAELVEAAVATCAYLAEPAYAAELAAWSRAEARIILLTRWLDEVGPLDDEGNPRPALAALSAAERTAADRRHALGLTPMARAKLGRDVAGARFDLARAWAEEVAPGDVNGWSEGAA